MNQITQNDQITPDATGLSDGKYVITWSSNGNDGSSTGIAGRIYSKDGSAYSDEFVVNDTYDDAQGNPSVTSLANGGFAVTWQSSNQDSSSFGVYSKIYDNSGKVVTPEFLVNTYTSGDQSLPSITSLSNGNIVVTWHSAQDGSSFGIYGQAYSQAGLKVGSEFQINTETSDFQQDPSVAGLAGGGYVVTWHSNNQDGSSWGVYGQMFDANGQKENTEFQVNSNTSNMQRIGLGRGVIGLADGGFVAVWHSLGQDGDSWGIYGQRYLSSGEAFGEEFRVNDTAAGSQSNPTITSLPTGGYVVSWQSENLDSSGQAAMYKVYDAKGGELTSERIANKYVLGNQVHSCVTSLASGGFLTTWTSENQDGSGYGIYSRVYNPTFGVDTQESAQNYLDKLSDAAVRVNANRANLGATQNRLENTITNLQIQAENLQDAESQISDVDVADEMTNFVKEQILSQAATAMLAQANSIPKMAIQLISGG